MFERIVSFALPALFILLWVLVIIHFIINRSAPVRTAKATVVDKQVVETFSKYAGTGKQQKYVIVFSTEGKKKSFYVSQFSYNGYRINEKGTLKYKGDRLISFH